MSTATNAEYRREARKKYRQTLHKYPIKTGAQYLLDDIHSYHDAHDYRKIVVCAPEMLLTFRADGFPKPIKSEIIRLTLDDFLSAYESHRKAHRHFHNDLFNEPLKTFLPTMFDYYRLSDNVELKKRFLDTMINHSILLAYRRIWKNKVDTFLCDGQNHREFEKDWIEKEISDLFELEKIPGKIDYVAWKHNLIKKYAEDYSFEKKVYPNKFHTDNRALLETINRLEFVLGCTLLNQRH